MDKLQDKVKLPKEVAAQLDWINQHHDYPVRVVVDLFNGQAHGDLTVLSEYFESDRSRRITLITQALVNGYEVEQTPDEMMLNYFQLVCSKIENKDQYNPGYVEQWKGEKSGITNTLAILGITIEGVNTK